MIDDILDLIFESIADEEEEADEGDNQNGEEGMSLSDKIINNRMIDANYGAIKKRIFVKEKYLEDNMQGGAYPQGRVSMMSRFISQQNTDRESDFLIPSPPDNSLSIKIKIYFFSTPNHIEIHVAKKNSISDIIRHIMTLYQKEPEFNAKHPL